MKMCLHSSFGHSPDTSVLHMNHCHQGFPELSLVDAMRLWQMKYSTGQPISWRPHDISQSGLTLTILPPPLMNQGNRHVVHIFFFKLNTSININLIKQVHVTFYCKSNKFFKCINKLQYSLYNSVWPWIHNTPSASISVCYHSRHEPKNIAKSVFTLGKFISLYLVFYYW